MSIYLLQTEKTYNVKYKGKSYTVTVLEDFGSGYVEYDIFDNNGIQVTEEWLELELLNYLEENSI